VSGAAGKPGTPVPQTFDPALVHTDGNTTEEIQRAGALVMARMPTEAWFDRPEAGTWGVLDALLGTMRPVRHHGHKPSSEYAAARHAWLERCRDWIRATTGRVLTTSQIPDADQILYTAATGDVWTPPADAKAFAHAADAA
jgi:hypothetical protein